MPILGQGRGMSVAVEDARHGTTVEQRPRLNDRVLKLADGSECSIPAQRKAFRGWRIASGKRRVGGIKEHKLQNQENKRIIEPDSKLKKLLGNGDNQVTYFNLQTYMKHHYPKNAAA